MPTQRKSSNQKGDWPEKKVPSKPKAILPHVCAANKLGPTTKKIGEFATLCLFGPVGNVQYTICRPIGATDLDSKLDWIMIQTDHVPGALLRVSDPKQAEVNKKKSEHRSKSLVEAKLLIEDQSEGQTTFMYPVYKEMSRNAILGLAEKEQKRIKGELKTAKLAFSNKTPAAEIAGNTREMQLNGNVLNYLSDDVRVEEENVRKHINSSEFQKLEEEVIKSEHRTLIGPFGDQEQQKLSKMSGKPLIDVLAAVHKRILGKLMSGDEV